MKNIILILFITLVSMSGFSQNDNNSDYIDVIHTDSDIKGDSNSETPSEIDSKAFNSRKKIKLDKYSVYIIKDGKEVFYEVFGTKCKIVFKKDLYTISFQTKKNTTAYQKLKVVSRKNNEEIVKIVGDLSPKPLSFIVKDSLDTKQKIDFISIDSGNVIHGMKFSD